MRVMQDIPRFYTGLAEWGACFLYLLLIPGRMKGWRFGVVSAAALVLQCSFLILTATVPVILWIPCMLIAFSMMFLYIAVAGGKGLLLTLYSTFHAFILAEFAASLEWQLEWFFLLRHEPVQSTSLLQDFFQTSYIFMIHIYLLVFLVNGWLQWKLLRGKKNIAYSYQEVAAAGMIALFTFTLSNLSFITVNTPFSARIEQDIFSIRTLVDFGGLSILYAFETRINELKAEQELTAVTAMLKSQYDSYRSYQDTIDIINLKYHDLKHQLAGLRAAANAAERSEYLDVLERELEQYRPEKQTGSHVLDAIIAGKSVRGRSQGIQLTCVADGRLLSFMHVTDICTIFGNALDNAIENTALVEDPEKRLIHMQVTGRRGFLFIRVDNYCENELLQDGDNLRTTKPDPANHGNGIRSMRYAAEKYGGTLTYDMKDHIFSLRILIPMPEEERHESAEE